MTQHLLLVKYNYTRTMYCIKSNSTTRDILLSRIKILIVMPIAPSFVLHNHLYMRVNRPRLLSRGRYKHLSKDLSMWRVLFSLSDASWEGGESIEVYRALFSSSGLSIFR